VIYVCPAEQVGQALRWAGLPEAEPAADAGASGWPRPAAAALLSTPGMGDRWGGERSPGRKRVVLTPGPEANCGRREGGCGKEARGENPAPGTRTA